jgi:hypothetical protein
LDALAIFEKLVKLMENGTNENVRTVTFDNMKELVAGQMKELCDEHNIRVITTHLHRMALQKLTSSI